MKTNSAYRSIQCKSNRVGLGVLRTWSQSRFLRALATLSLIAISGALCQGANGAITLKANGAVMGGEVRLTWELLNAGTVTSQESKITKDGKTVWQQSGNISAASIAVSDFDEHRYTVAVTVAGSQGGFAYRGITVRGDVLLARDDLPQVTLLAPKNGAANVSTAPALQVNANSGVSHYRFRVSKASGGAVAGEGVSARTSWRGPQLAANTEYSWTAAAVGMGLNGKVRTEGTYAPVWSFTTGKTVSPPGNENPDPGTPFSDSQVQLVSPANGAAFDSRAVEFRWSPLAGAHSYIVWVWPSQDTSHPTATHPSTEKTSLVLEDLIPGATHSWRVQGVGSTARERSALSEPRTLTISSSAKNPSVEGASVELAQPANGASFAAYPVDFSWKQVPYATKYEMVVYSDAQKKQVIYTQTVEGTRCRVRGLKTASATAYWQVRAIDKRDIKSNWSSLWHVTLPKSLGK